MVFNDGIFFVQAPKIVLKRAKRNIIVNNMYERYCAVITASNTLGTNHFPLASNDRFSVGSQVDSSFKHSIAMLERWKSQGRILSRTFSAHIVRLPRLFSTLECASSYNRRRLEVKHPGEKFGGAGGPAAALITR